MTQTCTISREHEKDLVKEVNWMIKRHPSEKVISIQYVYNSDKKVYTAFVVYKEEKHN